MPHFICRWPGGDVLLASVESRQELDAILQERCEPGVCKVARYHGPLVLELKPDIPGLPRASAEAFTPGPACPAFQPVWSIRDSSGDVDILANDGSSQRVHKMVLQCRLPILHGQAIAAQVQQVRLSCVLDGDCLTSLVHFLYLDDVQQPEQLTPQLHQAALACGLQRLVELCEAQFAQQLELQLVSLPGLSDARREAVLDSFIGWAAYAEQLGRQQLHHLCMHAVARHLTAAQSRPGWSTLSPSSTRLARLIAASTAPPLIHRQVAPDGAAVLPVPSNPPPASMTGPGSGPVVSVDAEAFAAAGGRLTSAEWLQLQSFRSAVADSLISPEACPISVEQQQLNSGKPATTQSSLIGFSVKQAVLGPHKRLMDSVLRFAFPATHTLFGTGLQLASTVAGNSSGAGNSNSSSQSNLAATAATPTAASAAAASRMGPFGPSSQPSPSVASLLGRPLTPSTAQATMPPSALPAAALLASSSQGGEASNGGQAAQQVPVPVPVSAAQGPLQHQSTNKTAAASLQGLVAAEHSASQTPLAAVVAASHLLEETSNRSSHTGCVNQPAAGRSSASGGLTDSPDGALIAGRLLRTRVLSGGGAGSAGRRAGQFGRLRAEARQLSWGSGVSAIAAEGSEQQQQAGAPGPLVSGQGLGLPPHMQRLLHGPGDHSSWGSGTLSRQSSDLSTQHAVASAQHLPGQQIGHSQVVHVSHLSIRTTRESPVEAEQTAAGSQQGLDWQQRESECSDSVAGAVSEPGAAQQMLRQQGDFLHNCVLSSSGSQLQGSAVLDLPVYNQLASGAAAGQGAAPSILGEAPRTPALSVPSVATGSSINARPSPVAALQRALVEDFVLYEEASAARQHVVGILVAIEQGDVAAGQRLLAPSCAELIAATAPVAAPNRLAAYASAVATAGGNSSSEAAAVRAAGEYLKNVKGVNKLLGMASSSRAALEPTPAQQQKQQQQLIRSLQRLGAQLPGLTRLLASHPVAAATIAAAGAARAASGALAQQQGAPGAAEPSVNGDSGTSGAEFDLNAAVADLMQLPELLQGLQLSVLLTQEQFNQRQQQLQQLASHAAAMLTQQANAATAPAGAAYAAAAPTPAAVSPAVAAVPIPAASTADANHVRERGFQAGVLFSSILASLGATAPTAPTAHTSRLGPGASQFSSAGALMAGSGASLLGYPYSGPAAAGTGPVTNVATGLVGAFTPTGVGALLAGGLLAEGGVAGDSIIEDMAADMLRSSSRRITCNGLYELCATLARPIDSPGEHNINAAINQQDGADAAVSAQVGATLSGQKRRISSAEVQQPAAKR